MNKTMRHFHDDSQTNLIEMLAREHRTVETFLDELAFLGTDEVDHACDLYLTLQSFGQMSKRDLVQHLSRR